MLFSAVSLYPTALARSRKDLDCDEAAINPMKGREVNADATNHARLERIRFESKSEEKETKSALKIAPLGDNGTPRGRRRIAPGRIAARKREVVHT